MNRRQRSIPVSRFALAACWVATLAIVLSSGILVARSSGGSHARHVEPALDAGAAGQPAGTATAFDAGSLDAALASGADGKDAPTPLVGFDASGAHSAAKATATSADLTPGQSRQLKRLVNQLNKAQAAEDAAKQKLALCQTKLEAAQQALADALAMPEDTPAEKHAKQIAIKKATQLINSLTSTIGSLNKKIDNLDALIASLIEQILAIDPDYFGGDPPPPPPAAPAGVTASAGTDSITVSWPAVDGATSYDVFWSTTQGVTPDTGTLVAGAASPWTHSGVTPGQTYYYVVTALNDSGMSPASGEVNATVQAVLAPNANSRVGINFTELTYYSPEWVFTDAMKQSMVFLPQEADSGAWNTGYPLHLDSNGWPILGTNPAGHPEAAGTLMYRDIGGHYPTGQYTCLYDGEGTIQFGFDAHTISSVPGKIVVGVDNPSNDGIYLKITSSNPANYVRNIRLMLPGFENSTEIFHPLFLQRLATFKVLRFIKWGVTNSTEPVSWATRTLPTWQTQAQEHTGVAFEYMVALANQLNADPWINIRVTADDDYVTQLATLLRDTLNPGLKVYIEHGNETWNSTFDDYQYCVSHGLALGLSTDPFLAGLRYHSQRCVEIFKIFETVFGGTDRLMRLLTAQGANPWTGVQVMDWQNAYQHADALSGANYFGFGLDTDPNVPNMTTAQILGYCANEIASTDNGFVASNAANAHQRGLKFVAYEGGQHLVGVGSNLGVAGVTNNFIAANHDPGMHALYTQCMSGFDQNGGDLFVMYAAYNLYSLWGSWGAMEYQDQDPSATTSPKYSAIMDYIAQQQAAAP